MGQFYHFSFPALPSVDLKSWKTVQICLKQYPSYFDDGYSMTAEYRPRTYGKNGTCPLNWIKCTNSTDSKYNEEEYDELQDFQEVNCAPPNSRCPVTNLRMISIPDPSADCTFVNASLYANGFYFCVDRDPIQTPLYLIIIFRIII